MVQGDQGGANVENGTSKYVILVWHTSDEYICIGEDTILECVNKSTQVVTKIQVKREGKKGCLDPLTV